MVTENNNDFTDMELDWFRGGVRAIEIINIVLDIDIIVSVKIRGTL